MEDQLISFETAKLADSAGFDIDNVQSSREGSDDLIPWVLSKRSTTFEYYRRPTQSLLQRWLREIAKLDVLLVPDVFGYVLTITNRDTILRVKVRGSNLFEKYEDGLEEGLQQAAVEYKRLLKST